MVDDHTQRPFRSNETVARSSAPAKAAPSGNDPLAELARLIGQSDPFSEFGRDGVRRVAPPSPPPQEPAQDWDGQPTGAGYQPPPIAPEPHFGAPPPQGHDYYEPVTPPLPPQNFGRPQFGGAPLTGDLYAGNNEVPGYEDDRFHPNDPHLAAGDEDFYDDEPPTRRRMGILVIAGVFALAVIGTAGAFGYRALFGTSSSSLPPPVIKADSTPSKIVPAANIDAQSSKQITDRINDRGIGEKLVSREEQPVAVNPQSADNNGQPALGSGVVGSEPKKVRTIAIRPDGSADPVTAPAPATPPRPAAAAPVKPAPPLAPSAPPRVVSTPAPTADDAAPAAPPPPRPAVVAHATTAPAPASGANAPLSLNPDAPAARPAAPARAPAAPARTAAVTPSQPAPAASGSYAVQVSSQRSEAEAQAAFRSLQGKYPGQLGGKQAVVRQVDLGDKGVYYRAMVPAGSSGEASELCNGLKAAGGSCIIQRN